jgi:hypothetical protein
MYLRNFSKCFMTKNTHVLGGYGIKISSFIGHKIKRFVEHWHATCYMGAPSKWVPLVLTSRPFIKATRLMFVASTPGPKVTQTPVVPPSSL